MTEREVTPDPRAHEVRPPFPPQQQPAPGRESEMTPRPDFGELSYQGAGKLEGRVALITGADSGIGRAVALAFAREGADILISYLSEHEDAHETERVVRESGRRAVLMAGDIQEQDHCNDLVLRCIEEFGRLDILINNAAFQVAHDEFTEVTAAELDRTYRTNVYAMFFLCKAAVPFMRPGGSIINVASIQAYQPRPQLLPYASTKGAIVTFSKGLSRELIKKGIRVNVVAPGPVWTPLIVSTMPQEKIQKFGENAPIGRAAQPAEIAPTFVFLASDDSRYVNGEVVGITGGEFTM